MVNLDALIPRADLFAVPDIAKADSRSIKITDLKPGLVYSLLRKPDFQRETSNWTPQQVAALIQTFSKSDIIPAIILWQSGNRVFVVDGAHRLSALVAWIRNDYGAGDLSIDFFNGKIPDHQRLMHEETLTLVNSLVGTWEQLESQASILGLKEIQLQWIDSPSAEQAADAFIRINQGGTVIDNLEVRILRAKRSALAIATRVIARGGTGHEYWSHFEEPAKSRAPKLGAEISKLLFQPPLELPVKTMDVPLAGFGYGSHVVRFAFDLVALANDLPVPDSTRKKATDNNLPDDGTGSETVKYLQRAKRAVQLILSNDPMSLGLHPVLYFYTAGGSFQAAALHNAVAWFLDLEKRGKLQQFLKIRKAFESLILSHPVIVKPAAHKLGSGGRTRSKTLLLFDKLFSILSVNSDPEKAWRKVIKDSGFAYLVTDERDQKEETTQPGRVGGKFSRGAKTASYLTATLPTVARCRHCGGLLHRNGMVADHTKERSAGGSSASSNVQWVHPICNSNRKKADGMRAAHPKARRKRSKP